MSQVDDGIEEFYYSNDLKANCLNNFFTSVSNFDDSNVQLPPFDPKTLSTMDNIAITESDVKQLIEVLDSNKAVGPDCISHKVLKNAKCNIAKPLCCLFNRFLQDGIFPKMWKTGLVIPLFKKSEKHSSGNYRHISLLSCLGKLMERCVYKYLYNYLISNSLLYANQSGFLTGHSTVYQLIDIYHQIVQSFDKKKKKKKVHALFSVTFPKPLTEFGLEVFCSKCNR